MSGNLNWKKTIHFFPVVLVSLSLKPLLPPQYNGGSLNLAEKLNSNAPLRTQSPDYFGSPTDLAANSF